MSAEKPQHSEKALRYINALSQARCAGKWSELAELARKVEKHTGRKCLAQSARTQASQEQHLASKASGSVAIPVEPLLATIPLSGGTKEDIYQGRVCAQWIHWLDGKYDQAILVVPPEVVPSQGQVSGNLMDWTHVCFVKSAFLRGASYEALGKIKDAESVYSNAISEILKSGSHPVKATSQYKFWLERLLNRHCQIQTTATSTNTKEQASSRLEAFRAWSAASQQDVKHSGYSSGGLSHEDRLSRRKTWLAYYRLLSLNVSEISQGPDRYANRHANQPAKLALCNEVRHVETTYEAILLRDLSFPRADQYSSEVDEWITQAMLNWSAFTGPAWADSDVPAPGKRALSRIMLDSLYRATTRTFHSMTILRSLSIVHTALGEFDMAKRALDQYVTLALKVKARVSKSGHSESGVDSDDTMVRAIVAGIEMLCAVGDSKFSAHAHELATTVSKLLKIPEGTQFPLSPRAATHHEPASNEPQELHLSISNDTLSLMHRALGISSKKWASFIINAQQRSVVRADSIKHLRRALQGGPSNESSIESLFALGFACADNRDTSASIIAIKEALMQIIPDKSTPDDDHVTPSVQPWQLLQSASIRGWHLMTLLLTSRQDFEKAAASCDEALEQWGAVEGSDAYKHLSASDKRNFISLRMTRIAIKQVIESTEAAINDSGALIALHSDVYSQLHQSAAKTAAKSIHADNGSQVSEGHSLNIRGSIFGRKGNRSSQNVHPETVPAIISSTGTVIEKDSAGSFADGDSARPATSHSTQNVSKSGSKRLQKRPSKKSVARSNSAAKPHMATDEGATKLDVSNVNKGATVNNAPQLGPKISGLDDKTHSGDENNINNVLPHDSATTFIPCPSVLYREAEEQRQSHQALAGIWLFIASLYRDAELYSDSADSLHEALEQVRNIETLIVRENGSKAEAFQGPGWEDCKNVDELWADAYAERGRLRLAQSRPLTALAEFESALTHCPSHVPATIGLANILLDIYCGRVSVPKQPHPSPAGKSLEASAKSEQSTPILASVLRDPQDAGMNGTSTASTADDTQDRTESSHEQGAGDLHDAQLPATLDKLAARDRAFTLLSALSKLSTGWHDSEVWYALSRAYEESGQPDKAQEALWWVVELEKTRPIRPWASVGSSYSLWI